MENQELIKQVTEKAEKWLTPAYDAETQAEVKRMLENPDKTELIDSFYKGVWNGRSARHHGCRYKPHEHLHRRCRNTGLVQLSEQMFCRKEGYFRCCGARLPQQ